jgi:predicted transposase YbfD/YdcC
MTMTEMNSEERRSIDQMRNRIVKIMKSLSILNVEYVTIVQDDLGREICGTKSERGEGAKV